MSDKEQSEAVSHLQMAFGGIGTVIVPNGDQSAAYHAQLWWLIDGISYYQPLSSVAGKVFCPFPRSAANERGFTVRSGVHNKTRKRLANYISDKQSFVVTTHRSYSVVTLLSTRPNRVCWSSA